MDDRGLRYRIITSSVTSIVALAVAIILWLASGNTASLNSWGGLAVTITVAYILLEMNTRNALLRVRSKMVSSTGGSIDGLFHVLPKAPAAGIHVPCVPVPEHRLTGLS